MRRVLEKIGRKLRKPIFGTQAVPRDSHLDLSQLPEHAFPVYCNKCDYCLRGIPDGRCPECGKEFTREKLLIEQYVSGAGMWARRRSPLSKLTNWTIVLSLVLPITFIGFGYWAKLQAKNIAAANLGANLDVTLSAAYGLMIFWRAVVGFSFGVFVWQIVHAVRKRKKRKQVLNAICEDTVDNASSAPDEIAS